MNEYLPRFFRITPVAMKNGPDLFILVSLGHEMAASTQGLPALSQYRAGIVQ
jgi:hypothetical protein